LALLAYSFKLNLCELVFAQVKQIYSNYNGNMDILVGIHKLYSYDYF